MLVMDMQQSPEGYNTLSGQTWGEVQACLSAVWNGVLTSDNDDGDDDDDDATMLQLHIS